MVYFPLAASDCHCGWSIRFCWWFFLDHLASQNAWIYPWFCEFFRHFGGALYQLKMETSNFTRNFPMPKASSTTIHCHKKDQTKFSDCDCHRDFDSDYPYFQLQMGWNHCSHFRILAEKNAPQSLLGEFSGADRTHGFKHVRNMFKSWISEHIA